MTFDDLDVLLKAPPLDLGATDWAAVGAGEAEDFARATHRHVSSGLAPLHLLALTNRFLPALIAVPAASSGVNYGADSVRFGPEIPLGARVRARASLMAAAEVAGGVQTTIEISIEAEGASEASCVVRSLSRWLR